MRSKRVVVALIVLIILFIPLSHSSAGEFTINDLWPVEVSLNNLLYFNEEVIITEGVVYYPLEGLVSVLKKSLNKTGEKIIIEGTETIIFPAENRYRFKDQKFESNIITLNKRTYLLLEDLKKIFQVEMIYNSNLLLINIRADLEEKEEETEKSKVEKNDPKPDFSLSNVVYNFTTDYQGYKIDYSLIGRFFQGEYTLNSNLRDGIHNLNSGKLNYDLNNFLLNIMKNRGVMYYKDGQEVARITGLNLRSKDSPFRLHTNKTTFNFIMGEDKDSNLFQSGFINYNYNDNLSGRINYTEDEDKVFSTGISHYGERNNKINFNYLHDLKARGDSFKLELDRKYEKNYFGLDYIDYNNFLGRDYNQMRAYFSSYQDNTYFNTRYKGNFNENITHDLKTGLNWFNKNYRTGTSLSVQNTDSEIERLGGKVNINFNLTNNITTKLCINQDFLHEENSYGVSSGYSHPQYGSFTGAINVYQNDYYGARIYWNKQFDQLRLSNRVSYIKKQDEVETPFNLWAKYMIDNNTYVSGKYSRKEKLNKYDIELNKDFQQGTSLTFDFVYQNGEDIDDQWEFKTGLTGSFGIVNNKLVLGQDEIERGVVRGIVYLDKNNNGKRDKGEKGISGIQVSLNENDITITNKKGEYVFNNVKPGSHEIKLDLKSIDIKYSPTSPGQQISLEQGEIGIRDLGLTVTGIADGYVVIKDYDQLPNYKKRELSLNKIRLILSNSDFPITKFNNGYYFVDQIPPGEYTIRLDQSSLPDWVEIKKSKHTFVITEEGEYVSGLDFVILVN